MTSDFHVSMNEYLPLRDVVFNTLRVAILHGELLPGERLMEITLANRLGVSRTPVREAIRKLELEGLVIMVPRKGAQLEQIREAALEFEQVMESDDITALAQADVKFHELIYEATKNRRLIQIINNLREQMYRYRIEYLKDGNARRTLVKEHREIYEALKERDYKKANDCMRDHIENQQKAIIKSLHQSE